MQKRINTRIFQLGGKVPDNPAPGTVLDHTVGGIIAGFIIIACVTGRSPRGTGTTSSWCHSTLARAPSHPPTTSLSTITLASSPTSSRRLAYIARIGLEAFHLNPDQLQADSHVLQLAGHSESASSMSIRSQACLSGLRTT